MLATVRSSCYAICAATWAAMIFADITAADPPPLSPVDDSHPRARLITGSRDLLGYIALTNPRFRQVGQLAQVNVNVENLSENRYTLEYRFEWMDDQGFAVDGKNVWHRFTLSPQGQTTVASMGKTPDAKNIVFTVRFPDDVFIEDHKQLEKRRSGDSR